MLQVHEIRVGNNVFHKNKIITIGVDDIHCAQYPEVWKQYHPIPINNANIKKLGFEKTEFPYWYKKGKIWFDVADKCFCFEKYGKQVNLEVFPKYIHQLQNIVLDLTNEIIFLNK